MQEVKRDMYAMRNGVVAETLRRAGSPYRFIMGVNIPQLKEIAQRYGADMELAAMLRADVACRESQLLAPMIVPRGVLKVDEALEWLSGLTSHEAVDILCHSLLRHEGYALELARQCLVPSVPAILAYAGVRLLWNLVNVNPSEVKAMAMAESAKGRESTHVEMARIIEEVDFLMDTNA
ncbi:MAG: hypothetical protein NC484_02170 [Alloprevotella sp.]|nr:hypothetical protein [Alloprevotella sp.]